MNKKILAISSDITAALTTISLIPYDKDTMLLVNQIVPQTWIPWVIKTGIAATITLRLINHFIPTKQEDIKP